MSGDPGSSSSFIWPALVNASSTWLEVRPELFLGIDWEQFLNSAHYHGVHAIVSKRLIESGIDFPVGHRDLLRTTMHSTTTKSLPLVQEVLRITSSFRERQLRIAPYKGPVLAEQLWGSFALRECADLDFLVPREEADRAALLLRELGYSEVTPIAAHLRPALHRHASEEQFLHCEQQLLLELQWSPAPRVLGVDFDGTALWHGVREMEFAGDRALSPASEDLFLLLSIHGWKHNWSRLLWVGDIAQLIRSRALQWSEVFDFAERNRVLGIVHLAIEIAHSCFNTGFPQAYAPDRRCRNLAEHLLLQLQADILPSYLDWHRLMLAARDTRGDKLRQVTRFLLTPGLAEYNFVALPSWARAGYRAIRLARVFRFAQTKTRD